MRMCVLVGRTVSPWRRTLRSLMSSTHAQHETVYFLLHTDQDIELLAASPVPCLPLHDALFPMMPIMD